MYKTDPLVIRSRANGQSLFAAGLSIPPFKPIHRAPHLFGSPKLNAVLNRLGQILFAANVSLGCENGGVSKQKLDLFKLPSRRVTPSCATAAEIVRRKLFNSSSLGAFL